ncbi:prolyl oligopeptidase family serine peptidase [Stomatohabitans albus]|uniref:prolyl oligopeptidase family serine peptidase n=1 Tax=Stomatohabitans albus TaxID=3110766 RepID=UPI00300DA494
MMIHLADLPAKVARSLTFSLGHPRSFSITPSGVFFLRSPAGEDPVHDLWHLPITEDGFGTAYCLVDAHKGDAIKISAEEAARRERVRERAQGIVAYSVDQEGSTCAFTWGDGVGIVTVEPDATIHTVPTPGVMAQPTLSPDGRYVAGVIDGALWCLDINGGGAQCLAREDGKVTWGLPDFIAAEEMGRQQGFWWSPESTCLCVARVDNTALGDWWISAPVDPERPSTPMPYPPAGGTNASISLWTVTLDGNRQTLDVHVGPDHPFEYLASVQWLDADRLVVSIQTRDQQHVQTLVVPTTGAPVHVLDDNTQQPYVELLPGLPHAFRDDAGEIQLLTTRIVDNHRVLALNGQPLNDTYHDWTLLGVSGVFTDGRVRVGVNGIPAESPWLNTAALLDANGATAYPGTLIAGRGPAGEVIAVVRETSLDGPPITRIIRVDHPETPSVTLDSFAMPLPETGVSLYGPMHGPGRSRSLLLVPGDWTPSKGPLPVLVSSYGGPHFRAVTTDRTRLYEEVFFCAQGYAVIMTDGLGAPGGGVDGEYAIVKHLAATVQSQVDAIDGIDAKFPGLLDRERIAIRGWSYGGYLSARAVLERPDVFKAGIAGAPVTDWRLYDTHYTERYLGNPNDDPAAYEAEALAQIATHVDPATWCSRLLLIHGLADDNVVMAHTLRLSASLLAQGLPHEVLPLSDVTHFTPSVTINTNMKLHQLDFLRRNL